MFEKKEWLSGLEFQTLQLVGISSTVSIRAQGSQPRAIDSFSLGRPPGQRGIPGEGQTGGGVGE